MTNEVRVNTSMTLEDMGTELTTALGAAAEQFWQENPLQALIRSEELSRAEGQPQITPSGIRFPEPKERLDQSDAMKQVQDAGVDLEIGERGITKEALEILISRKREENKRQALIQSAPSGFWSGAAQFGTGLAVSLADPINIASAFIPVVGTARYTSMLAKAGSTVARAGVRARVGAASGVVGAIAVEPLVLLPMMQEQADYGLYDSFLNITFGGVLGGGLHAGAGAIGDVIAKASPQAKSDVLKAAVGQMMDEGQVDVSRVAQEHSSFRQAYRDAEIRKVIDTPDGEVNPRVKAEFDKALDEVVKRETSKFEAMNDEVARKALKDIEEGRPTKAMMDEAISIASKRVDDFKAEPQIPPKLKDVGVKEPLQVEELTPQNALTELDTETQDIFTALEESGEDLTGLRESVKELETKHTRDLEGIKAGIMCGIGQ